MAYACDDIGKERWFKPQVTPESLTSDMKVVKLQKADRWGIVMLHNCKPAFNGEILRKAGFLTLLENFQII